MDIRRLRVDEVEAAARLHRQAGLLIPGHDPTMEGEAETVATYRLSFSRGPIWGAFEEGRLVAHLALEPGWIEHLYVEPAFHGRGIGRALVALAQGEQDDLQLFTRQANERACRLYERTGFTAEEYGVDETSPMRAANVRYRWRRQA